MLSAAESLGRLRAISTGYLLRAISASFMPRPAQPPSLFASGYRCLTPPSFELPRSLRSHDEVGSRSLRDRLASCPGAGAYRLPEGISAALRRCAMGASFSRCGLPPALWRLHERARPPAAGTLARAAYCWRLRFAAGQFSASAFHESG